MNFFSLLESTGALGGTGQSSPVMTIVMFVAMGLVLWLFILRPQSKERKKQKDMLASLDVGDGVTTIGGIIGRVVTIKDDYVQIETGSDRIKIRFAKSAIAEVEKLSSEN